MENPTIDDVVEKAKVHMHIIDKTAEKHSQVLSLLFRRSKYDIDFEAYENQEQGINALNGNQYPVILLGIMGDGLGEITGRNTWLQYEVETAVNMIKQKRPDSLVLTFSTIDTNVPQADGHISKNDCWDKINGKYKIVHDIEEFIQAHYNI